MLTTLPGHRVVLSLACSSLWLARLALAAPPPNDTCGGAEVIPSAGPFPYYSSVVNVKEATLTGDPPAPNCRSFSVTNAVWYRFTPSTTHKYVISVGTDTATTVLDTVMSVYTNSGGCGGSFTPLFCSDDDSGRSGLQSAVYTNLTANVTYYILVWTTSLSPLLPGQTSVQVRVSRPDPPPNDTCAGAEMIPPDGPFPYLTAIADTTEATVTGDPSVSCWPSHIRSVWFKFTPAVTTPYELSLCTNTATTVYETLLAVYTAPSGCGGSFIEVGCNHTNPCSNLARSIITMTLTNGVTYYIVAWEGDTEPFLGESDIQLRVTRWLPPAVTNVFASSITSTNAVLNASVNPNGLLTAAWFEWGATASYGNMTSPQNLGSGTNAVAMNAQLTGLSAGNTYHFRAKATNIIGAVNGTDQAFTWSNVRPNLTSFGRSIDGTFALQFLGAAGQVYLVQASTNLTNWSVIGSATANGSGNFSFVDTNSGSFANRFYRVLAP